MISNDMPDTANGSEQKTADFQINLTISVENTSALWSAALRRHYQITNDLTFDEITECIGPREDPSLAECLTTLALSFEIDGCRISDISVPDIRPVPPQLPSRAIAMKASGIDHPLLDAQAKHRRKEMQGPEMIVRRAHVAGESVSGILAAGL